MTDLLQETEETPASHLASPAGMSDPATWIDAAIIWGRIKAYTRTRYTAREVVWTIEEREGENWKSPLTPMASQTAEKWESGGWVAVTLPDGPVGLCLPSDSVFKVTAQVGGGTPPAAVTGAFRRLAEYMADGDDDRAGVSSYTVNMGGAIQESYQRNAAHAARHIGGRNNVAIQKQNRNAGGIRRRLYRADDPNAHGLHHWRQRAGRIDGNGSRGGDALGKRLVCR